MSGSNNSIQTSSKFLINDVSLSGLQGEINCIYQIISTRISYIIYTLFISSAGSEAMFGDLGHFSFVSCRLLAYMGQAAYLLMNPTSYSLILFQSLLAHVSDCHTCCYEPMIASQAMLSATFSCINQYDFRVLSWVQNNSHTSTKFMGQIYVSVDN
ncbi:potassium transporter-like protein [Medicago truncatula]|uniref:Potassium transporter-like protein n=1 Tax=Medicago truncatula TaxID=3880 RepID=G7K1F2_MEDTR|nr:potassium transporter-like protein [Medicago truncatula]